MESALSAGAKMVKLEEAITAKYAYGGERFEVLVDPDLALELKKGKNVDFNELMAADAVFKDASKGEEQSPEAINKVFGTTDINEVAKQIILKGTVQLTTEQRREMREKRKREIIQIIVTNAINPQTNSPHPVQRIENAINEINPEIDPFKPAQDHLPAIMKELKKRIPISLEKLEIAIKIPAQFSGKAQPQLYHFKVKKEEWQSDGSLIAVVEIPAGLKNELLNKVNSITHGNCEVKVLNEEGSM